MNRHLAKYRSLLTPPQASRAGVASLLCAWALLLSGLAQGQSTSGTDTTPPAKKTASKTSTNLLERAPFDRLILDAENDNAQVDIEPLAKIPSNPKPSDRLRIRLADDPTQLYEVEWRHIAAIRTYNQLIFAEAQKLVKQHKYSEAFPYFAYLLKNTRVTSGLRRAIHQYLLDNARALVNGGHIDHGMAILEELHRQAPRFQQAEVAKTIAKVADQLISDYVHREDYRKARGLILHFKKRYGSLRVESLDRWRQKLIQLATQLKQQAEQQMAANNLRQAERLSRRMLAVWPDLPGAVALRDEIARRYPMLIVGVGAISIHDDPTSLDNWSARRTGPLTCRTLLQFEGAGPEGGQYFSHFGDYTQSDDRRQLILDLNPNPTPDGLQITGYDVAHQVVAMASPGTPLYNPSWAALIKGVRIEDVFRVRIDLRHPHVLPEAMLQFSLAPPPGTKRSPCAGPYRRIPSEDADTHFTRNPHFRFGTSQPLAEIVERYFGKSQDAIAALRRGDIDAIDYLFPADVAALRSNKSFVVEPYKLPTIHMLVPNPNNPLLASATFRRAILYGINRNAILHDELMGKATIAGYQVISGPFPIGTHENDPLGYAYDTSIAPRSYYPRLAAILRILALRELKEIAQRRDEKPPEQKPLVLGFPSNELARVACQAIAQYLQVVGIECHLRELPPGMSDDPAGEIDLLYKQVAMWEPVVDARQLLAPGGTTAVRNPYIGMALRRLDAAKNWREVRTRLHELHRIVHEQVAVIPLWQTVDFLVRSRRLHGTRPAPLTFYDQVESWSVLHQGVKKKK